VAPALDGFFHREVKIINFFSDDKANAADNGGAIVVVMTLDIENFPPKTPVGINAEESFTDSDENRKVENGIWGQLPELDPIEKQKGTKKLMRRKRKPAKQKGGEHDSKALGGIWARGRTWKTNIIVGRGDEDEGAELAYLAIGNS
jgi:hypothetical protein